MKHTPTPNAILQPGRGNVVSRLTLLFAYYYTLLTAPFVLTRFTLDILLDLFPWTRPENEWSINQAARMRVVKLVLLYWSRLRWGDSLTLRPGAERNRFEVMHPRSLK